MTILLLIAVLIVSTLWIVERKKLKTENEELTSVLDKENRVNKELSQRIVELENANSNLGKYRGIIDIEEKANEIIAEANKIAHDNIRESKDIVSKANEIANNTKESAVQYSNEQKKYSDDIVRNAHIQSQLTIENANKNAEEIAGDAYKAMQNAAEYTKTAKAMKNVIEGYGDQYLIPTYSLLDDLAEEFGHTDAGIKLKEAREYSRTLIKEMRAAKCDYVEWHRKITAINFVLDAFNGKTDSILSKVKKDNYGIMEQKIKDAFQLVNNNGKAFKDAVITQVYLSARISELRWAVVAQELKCEEQEEQRRIKEQIREEEKAKREYEKAMKEAQKEETTLKRLIEIAQKEVSAANEEQKAKFDLKLKELEIKLKEAEEKNKRALSMAQQTRSGNVYIISNVGSFGENVYKIGMTRRLEPLDRVKELGDASVPFEFDVHSMIYSESELRKNEEHSIPLSCSLSKVMDKFKNLNGYLFIAKDITEQKNKEYNDLRIAISSQEKERKRLAHDLHDSLGQELNAIKMYINSLVVMDPDTTTFIETFEACKTILDNSLDTIRNISFDLMPKSLEHGGLVQALSELVKRLCLVTDIEYNFPKLKIYLDKESQINLFRIIQEFINNSLKHAKSSKIKIHLIRRKKYIILSVMDNGKGFKMDGIKQGNGIFNIKNRLQVLNAQYNFESELKKGTLLKILIEEK